MSVVCSKITNYVSNHTRAGIIKKITNFVADQLVIFSKEKKPGQ